MNNKKTSKTYVNRGSMKIHNHEVGSSIPRLAAKNQPFTRYSPGIFLDETK
jgi:hypothetical protein